MASDWQIAILGAVDHQIGKKKRVKKRSDFMEYKRSMAIIACFLLGAEIITLLLFVYFNVLR